MASDITAKTAKKSPQQHVALPVRLSFQIKAKMHVMQRYY
jgi:hypothetical protein